MGTGDVGSNANANRATALHPPLAARMASRRLARPLLRVALVLLAGVGIVECVSFVAQAFAYPRVGYDFAIYYAAALTLRDNPHANLYSLSVLQSAAAAHHAARPDALYLYPPVLAVLLIPLTLVPYAAALHVWLTFCLLCWLAGAILLAAQLRGLLARRAVPSLLASPAKRSLLTPLRRLLACTDADLFAIAIGLFLVLAYGPLMQGFQLGQVTMPIFAITTAVPILLAREYDRTLGVLLGLATLLKLFPAILILYFALRGRRRVVTAALATIAVAVVALLPLLGFDGLLAAARMLTNGGANAQQFHNQSLARVPLWLAAAFGGTPSRIADLLGYVLLAVVLAAFAGGMLLVRRRSSRFVATPERDVWRDTSAFAWALCTMVLASPIVWEHYDAWLLPAVIVCLGYGLARQGARRQTRPTRRLRMECIAAAVVAFALTLNALPFAYDGVATFSPGPYIGGHPVRPYFMLFRPAAGLLLWLATGAVYLFQERLDAAALQSSSAERADAGIHSSGASAGTSVGALLSVCLGLVAAVVGVEAVTGLVTMIGRT